MKEIRQELASYPPLSMQLNSSDVTGVNASLSLDSETTLDLMLTTNENAGFKDVTLATISSNGLRRESPYEPELVGSRYRIRVDGIRAQDLDKPIIVSGYTENEADYTHFIINASPLSYAYAVLNADAFASNHGHDALCALYNYYLAAQAYIAAH